MGFLQNKYHIRVAFVFTMLCVSGVREVLSMRPLEGEQWLKDNDSLHIQSLRGKVPPTGGNPCTNIPGQGTGRCTLEIDVAGSVVGHEAFPGHVVNFAPASAANDTKKQDPTS